MDHVLRVIRRSMGLDGGADRGLAGADGASAEAPGAAYRSYCAELERAARADRRPYTGPPTLGLILSGAWACRNAAGALEGDLLGALRRTMTETLSGGPKAGFALPSGFAENVMDHARMTVGPFSLCNWWPVKTLEYEFPCVNEASRSRGSRWGGFQADWGVEETALPPKSDGKVAMKTFTAKRLMAQTVVSRDLLEDSERANRWLSYLGIAEIRQSIDDAIINGPSTYLGSTVGPEGILTSKATVTVPKDSGQAAGTISVTNINAAWKAIAPGNRAGAAWFASAETIEAIDDLAVSGAWPLAIYQAPGLNPAWPTLATIKGRPLIPCEACPTLGTPGDLICADLSDYVLTYVSPPDSGRPLGFSFDPPTGPFHRGLVGVPPDAVSARVGGQVLGYWEYDEVIISFKFRGDGGFLWNQAATSPSGVAQGPASIIAAR